MKNFREKVCPQCGMPKLKTWSELNSDQRFLAERLPLNSEFSPAERKHHLFCVNCWNEVFNRESTDC